MSETFQIKLLKASLVSYNNNNCSPGCARPANLLGERTTPYT